MTFIIMPPHTHIQWRCSNKLLSVNGRFFHRDKFDTVTHSAYNRSILCRDRDRYITQASGHHRIESPRMQEIKSNTSTFCSVNPHAEMNDQAAVYGDSSGIRKQELGQYANERSAPYIRYFESMIYLGPIYSLHLKTETA